MEKIVILAIVCAAFVLLALKLKSLLKGENPCCGCGSSQNCKDEDSCHSEPK